MIRFGIIGAGRIGRIHVENLCYRVPQAEVVSIADVNTDATAKWAKPLGINRVVSEAEDVWKDPSVDAVVICSPTDTHADYLMGAARAGKDIFCEKPIANRLVTTKQALAVAKEAGVRLQIGFNRRFDHNFQRIRQLVTQGELGAVHQVVITSRDPGPPPIEYIQVSGGIFMDMTIHDFDMARFLVGSEVTEVYARGSVLIDPKIGEAGDFDTAVVILTFANGATCVINNSRQAAYGYDQRVEVFGAKGNAIAGNDRPTNVIVSTDQSVVSDKPLYFFLERYMDSFARELQDFTECIVHQTQPSVTGKDGLKSLVIAMAATRSAQENRVVPVAEIEEVS